MEPFQLEHRKPHFHTDFAGHKSKVLCFWIILPHLTICSSNAVSWLNFHWPEPVLVYVLSFSSVSFYLLRNLIGFWLNSLQGNILHSSRLFIYLSTGNYDLEVFNAPYSVQSFETKFSIIFRGWCTSPNLGMIVFIGLRTTESKGIDVFTSHESLLC
jgi:hypothetical protein